MAGKRSNPVDAEVGRRIRIYRIRARISQGQLGEQIGVTFQQVQKYEKGVNRVGAGRLTQIAAVLRVPIGAFFEDIDAKAAPSTDFRSISDVLAQPKAVRLLQAFSSIPNAATQAAILRLVEAIQADRANKAK